MRRTKGIADPAHWLVIRVIAAGGQPYGAPIQRPDGSFVQAITTGTLEGGGDSGPSLPDGTANGQVLKWNGTTWVASTDTNTTYSAATTAAG